MAHLYQRGTKKIWYAKFYRNGRQVLKSLKTANFRIARESARILEAGLDLDDYDNGVIAPANNTPNSRIPISEAIEEFCQHLREIQTKNSYDSEISRLRTMFGPLCPSLEYRIRPKSRTKPPIVIDYLHELGTSVIRKYFQSQRRSKISASTELRNRAILHKLFEWAFIHYGFRSTEDPRYFPSSSGNRWHPDTFSHHLARMNKAVGLDWTCLDFRHTFGTQLAKRGISLYKISELMGNSPEICRRHYAAIHTEYMHKDVEFG